MGGRGVRNRPIDPDQRCKPLFDDRGAGAPILLIHAGLISRTIWEPLLPALTDDFRVITPDSRGARPLDQSRW